MRIVHVESGRHLYGGARQAGYLHDDLARRGIESVLVCPPGHALASCRPNGGVHVVPMGGDADPGMIGRLARAYAALDPDVVHVHSRRGADVYGGLAARAARKTALLTRRVDSRERAWMRWKYAPYRFVVAISSAVREQLCRAGIDPSRVPTIASAVDTGIFRPNEAARERVLREFALPDEAFIVGVCGQLIARKGHALLLHALRSIVREAPHVRVLCFGRGPLRARLERLAARLEVGAGVTFAGFRDDLEHVLPGIDLLVHPAEREGLGAAVLETMSCGVAVVATAAGGVVDAVTDGVNGLLVPRGDAAGLARAVGRLVADDALRKRLGRAGRIRVMSDFTVSRMTEAYLELYRAADERR